MRFFRASELLQCEGAFYLNEGMQIAAFHKISVLAQSSDVLSCLVSAACETHPICLNSQ